MSKPRFPRRPADAIDLSSIGRLSDADLAAIDARVAYTLSAENEARNHLRARIGNDAAARVESYLGSKVSGEARADRYADLARAFSSRVFLDATGPAADGPEAGLWPAPATAADGQTPTSNTGVTSSSDTAFAAEWEAAEPLKLVIGSGRNSKILEVPQRRGHNGDAAFIDWVHLTIGKETCDQYGDFLASDDERVLLLSYRLERIFGFGVTAKHKSGRNFYAESWGLGNDKESWGYVCIGGQENTILIGITGTGCMAAKQGWEQRLVNWLELEAERPKLTRVDLAFDDFFGDKYDLHRAELDFESGEFQSYQGAEPLAERIGSDWLLLERLDRDFAQAVAESAAGCGPVRGVGLGRRVLRGRTFAVGRRASGKYARIYERGRKLGSSSSPWVRVEVEHKAVERVLPFDMLLLPGQYLAGSYPAFKWVNDTQNRIVTHKKQLEITLQSSIDFVRLQAGQHINVLLEALGSDGFVSAVRRDGIPKRFKVADLDSAPVPVRISDRLDGMTSDELNALTDLHIQGFKVPAAFYGHRQESPHFRPD